MAQWVCLEADCKGLGVRRGVTGVTALEGLGLVTEATPGAQMKPSSNAPRAPGQGSAPILRSPASLASPEGVKRGGGSDTPHHAGWRPGDHHLLCHRLTV